MRDVASEMTEQAGRELDAKVAERVMGAKYSNVGTAEWMHFPTTGPYADCDCERHIEAMRCPEYSTSITAAWEVLEKTKLLERYVLGEWEGGWAVQYLTCDDLDAYVTAPTAPLAICLAALKAVGEGNS